MTIATWNINGMQARLGFVRHWLAARGPDLALLQELKLPDDRFPHVEFRESGYRALVHGQKSWNGVAVLAREETVRAAEVICRGLPGLEELGARLIGVRSEVDGLGPLDCVSVYVPNGRTVEHAEFGHKLAFLDGLVSFAEREVRPDRPLVIGGDFNLCPAALDTWDGRGGGRRSSTPRRSAIGSRRCSPWARWTCSAPSTPICSSFPGGTTAPATSTRTWDCASTSCWPRRRSRSGPRRSP